MLTSNHSLASLALIMLLVGLGLTAAGCDFLDPTEVENPQTTEDDLEGAPNLVSVFLPGLEAQFARALGSTVVTTEIASDNYSIHGTGLGGTAMDFPERITPTTPVINTDAADTGSYWNLQELRALTDYVLTEILPEDEDASNADVAQVHYYRGMAFLMQAENFSAVPIEENDTPRPAAELYTLSEAAFQEARSLSTEESIQLRTSAALARLHRGLGNPEDAAAFAQEALAVDDLFIVEQGYDSQNLVNAPHLYLVTRISREMQPLPRLDFLDPKYTTEDDAIVVAKAEEMHLIMAESALAQGSSGEARTHLNDVIALTNEDSRRLTSFEDEDQRTDNNLNPRPRTSDIKVAFEPGAPFVEGLVLDRPCPEDVECIETPSVSATSITEDAIDAASGDELVRLLYQMRQEVLFLEGRRLHDLGLRLPMMLPELEQNPNIAAGDLGTETIIPSYIPPANEMDLYTPVEIYNEGETLEDEITMLHDMNRILAEERGLVMQNPRLP